MKLSSTLLVVILSAGATTSIVSLQGPIDDMSFARIPAGILLIGEHPTHSRSFDEIPGKIIHIASFEIMTTEVTQGMWEELMESDSSSIPHLWTHLCGAGSEYPVYAVTWYDCAAFINSLNNLSDGYIYRLPSESEWEYACRAGTDTEFYWGNSFNAETVDVYCRCTESSSADNPESGMLEVASLEPNNWGLFDMSGNVSEWCTDRYSYSYAYLPEDGSPFFYPCADSWPHYMSSRRVHRGGSWLTSIRSCRTGSRSSKDPHLWATDIGFRLVRVPETRENIALQLFHEAVDSTDSDAQHEANVLFGRALKMDPTIVDALLYRGLFRHELGETDQALRNFYRAIELDPNNAGSHQMLGVLLTDLARDREAMECYDRVLELDPEYPLVYFHRGITQLMLWNVEEAVVELTIAITQDPFNPSPFYARAYAYYELGQPEFAIEDLNSAIERSPNNGDYHMFRSEIQREMGNLEEASADSLRASQLGVSEEW